MTPEPVEGVGEPTPETEKATGMNVSFSPFRPVTCAVTVAVVPTSGLCVGGAAVTAWGGEKLTRAVNASVPDRPERASAQEGWTTSSLPTKLPL